MRPGEQHPGLNRRQSPKTTQPQPPHAPPSTRLMPIRRPPPPSTPPPHQPNLHTPQPQPQHAPLGGSPSRLQPRPPNSPAPLGEPLLKLKQLPPLPGDLQARLNSMKNSSSPHSITSSGTPFQGNSQSLHPPLSSQGHGQGATTSPLLPSSSTLHPSSSSTHSSSATPPQTRTKRAEATFGLNQSHLRGRGPQPQPSGTSVSNPSSSSTPFSNSHPVSSKPRSSVRRTSSTVFRTIKITHDPLHDPIDLAHLNPATVKFGRILKPAD